jgi:peptidyl-prolyl cis-trans isomerase B (cyclophilin B)
VTFTVFSKKEKDVARQYPSYPEMMLDLRRTYTATIKTNRGDVELELFAAEAPKTVNNFVFLARDGFYDGLTFHRVIPGFVAQGGCPHGTGMGGPGYEFEDETRGNPHKHEAGSLSMANAGPNTNGSQFFICYGPQPHLDGRHTVFGKVMEGMDVVLSLEQGDFMEGVVITED